MFRRLAASAVLLASACGGKPQAPPPAAPDVLVTPVVQQDVPITKEWIGTVDGSVNAEIRPKVEGYLLRRLYEEGSLVKAGQPMFELDPRQFQAALENANGVLGRAEADLEKARRDVARYTPLAAQKAISQKELDDATSARDQALAQVASAKAQVEQATLNLAWTRVNAPISGIAGIAAAQVGDLVGSGTKMTTVSALDPVLVVFNISETEYLGAAARISKASEGEKSGARIELRLVLTDGTVYASPGHIRTIDRQVDVKTGTLTVKGEFPNPGNVLRPGQYAKVRAVVDERKGALLVPQRAVSEMQGNYLVGVIKADGTADVRSVTPGPLFGAMWVIDKGLEAGDQVVVEGLQFVRPGAKVTSKPAPQS